MDYGDASDRGDHHEGAKPRSSTKKRIVVVVGSLAAPNVVGTGLHPVLAISGREQPKSTDLFFVNLRALRDFVVIFPFLTPKAAQSRRA
jgi:hypothetical protein